MKLFSFFFVLPQADYHPAWPQWLRWLGWAVRNPFPGLAVFDTDKMAGVGDWNVKGGWLFVRHTSGLPFISYRGKYVEFYAGWKPNGAPGLALRRANSHGY